MKTIEAPRLHRHQAVKMLCVKLTSRSLQALELIQSILRQEGIDPSTPISLSVAVRRALEVYGSSLLRQSGRKRLGKESRQATRDTYTKEGK
jgi:hypothetical protein